MHMPPWSLVLRFGESSHETGTVILHLRALAKHDMPFMAAQAHEFTTIQAGRGRPWQSEYVRFMNELSVLHICSAVQG